MKPIPRDDRGFHHVGLLLAIVLAAVGLVGWRVYTSNSSSPVSNSSQLQNTPAQKADPSQPPLKLKTIGVNLDYYNPSTNHAGDFVFTKAKVNLDRIFLPYGAVIPGNSATGMVDKTDSQAELRLPMGTKVHSLVDGVVANVPKLYSDDYSVMVSDGKNTNWLYETEHVINVLVKTGDKVKAGQVIAEVSPHSSQYYDGLGVVELGILHGGQSPKHVCPFAYLDDSIKTTTLAKLSALMKSWQDYRGDSSLYDLAKMKVAGCQTLDTLNG